jgi:hypothetical protein
VTPPEIATWVDVKEEDYNQEDLLVKREWAEGIGYEWPPPAEGYADWPPQYEDLDGDEYRDTKGDDDLAWWEGEEQGLHLGGPTVRLTGKGNRPRLGRQLHENMSENDVFMAPSHLTSASNFAIV